MRFERSRDYALIRAIITTEQLYRAAADDFTPPAESYVLNESEAVHYILVRSDGGFHALPPAVRQHGDRRIADGETLGLFAFVPHNRVCWEMHTCLLPVAWGRSEQAMKGVIRWIFDHTECRRIIGCAPVSNGLVLRLAVRAGLTKYGVNEKSFLKGGVLLDQVCLGISKEDLCL